MNIGSWLAEKRTPEDCIHGLPLIAIQGGSRTTFGQIEGPNYVAHSFIRPRVNKSAEGPFRALQLKRIPRQNEGSGNTW